MRPIYPHRMQAVAIVSQLFMLIAFPLRAEEIVLTVTPSPAPRLSSVAVDVSAPFLGDGRDSSSISGQLTLELLPSIVNPQTARITALSLTVDETLQFSLGNFLVGRFGVTAAAGALQLELTESGPAGDLTNGTFDQYMNLIGLRGDVLTTAAPEPFDLAAQDPVEFDFDSVNLEIDRENITLTSEIFAEIIAPLDTGLLTIDVTIAVEGGVTANAGIPAADYVWQPQAPVASDYRFGETQYWLRNEISGTDSLPWSMDDVVFESQLNAGSPLITIDLEETRQVKSADFRGAFALQGGDIEIASGRVDAELLIVEADASLVSADRIRFSGQQLLLDGNAGDLRINDGRLAGHGTAESLVIDTNSVLQAVLDNSVDQLQPLTITSNLSLEGELQIVSAIDDLVEVGADSAGTYADPVERGEQHSIQLVNAGSIDADLQLVSYFGTPLVAVDEMHYELHAGAGLFRRVSLDATSIRLENHLAIIGDVNGDGTVAFSDFLALSSGFGEVGDWLQGDFNASGTVDFADFLLFSANFGETVAAKSASSSASTVNVTSVPSPASSSLFCRGLPLCGLILLARRRAR